MSNKQRFQQLVNNINVNKLYAIPEINLIGNDLLGLFELVKDLGIEYETKDYSQKDNGRKINAIMSMRKALEETIGCTPIKDETS